MATPHVPVTYTILTLAAARRQLIQLRKSHNRDVEEIIAAITSLSENARPARSKKLVHRPELRLSIGNYRVVYSIDYVLRTVTIYAVSHRPDVYR